MENIEKIAVVGAGTMGHGIAQVLAMSGQNVSLMDISVEILQDAKRRINASLTKLYDKHVLDETPRAVLRRLQFCTNLDEALRDKGLVIESVPEDFDLKLKILKECSRVAPEKAIIATNTSGLSVSLLSEASGRPEQCIGMHWMNPPYRSRIIEIVKGDKTRADVVKTIIKQCKRYNKEVVLANRDIWFFLSARSQAGWHLETAMMALREHGNTEEIDSMARNRLGLPMGPFELADLTGAADIRVLGLQSLKPILIQKPDFEPWPAFRAMFEYIVNAFWRPIRDKGLTGVKAGKGFYSYPSPGIYRKPDVRSELAHKIDELGPLSATANTAAWCVTNDVATVEEVDRCFKLAYNWPKGIFEFVNEYGAEAMVQTLRKLQANAPLQIKSFYEPDDLLCKWE